MNNFRIVVDEDLEGLRIDKYISVVNEELSRSFIQKIISENGVLVNGRTVKQSFRVNEGDSIEYSIPDNIIPDIVPEDIDLDIVYEDEDIIIVNKPKGMVVHPCSGKYTGTLVNALLFHCKDSLSGINGVQRPGIVHRIDKDTTGLLVVCKNDNSHKKIAEQLKEHSVTRRYEAICCGCLDNDGTIDAPIGRNTNDRKKMGINYENGKNAVTHYRVIERLKGFTHIECRLETGRTHQIRVHMASIGHPLLGDEVYGGARKDFERLQGQTLHAGVLGLILPSSDEYMEWRAQRPEYFEELLRKLRT